MASSDRPLDTILYVDDEPANLQLFRLQMADHYRVLTANGGEEALQILEREDVRILATDERMPGMRGIDLLAKVFDRWPDVLRVIVSAYCDADRLLLSMNRGHAHEYVLKPWLVADLLACLDRCLAVTERRRILLREAVRSGALSAEERPAGFVTGLVGESSGLRHAVNVARRAAGSDATVLIHGETGTGKEVFARLIHEASQRARGPFVRLNCGALAEGLLESELFGHEQGAFTGASRVHKGRFELADGGSLFLDEIGDISAKVQVSLLRILQERTFERVGGTRSLTTDVRIVAATHRDLGAAVRAGQFREDLFFRLNVIPIEIPPLRERAEDISPLIDHFLNRYGFGRRKTVHPTARAALCNYEWPGNVRELENVVQRAMVLGVEDELTWEDFSLRLSPPPATNSDAPTAREEGRDLELERLRDAIVRNGGNLARAARMLGVPRTTLASRAARLGLV